MLRERFDEYDMINSCRNFLIETSYYIKAGLDDIPVFYYKKKYFIENSIKNNFPDKNKIK